MKKTQMEFVFFMVKAIVWGKGTALALISESMNQQDKKGDCQTYPRQARTILQNSLFLKNVGQIYY